MKTIAFFSGYYLPHTGGIERYEDNLAKKLAKQDIKVIIVTTKYEKKLKDIEELGYATVYRFPIYHIFSSRYPIIRKNKNYKKMIKQLEQEEISYCMLNTRFQLTSLMGAKFANKHHIPVCIVEHGTSHFTVYNKVLDFFGHIYEHLLTKYIKKYVKEFYGVSKACCKWLEHYKIVTKGVLYNSIETSEYELYKNNMKKNENIKILYAGRLIEDKGLCLLEEAYQSLRKKYSKIELLIAGDGPLYEQLKKNTNISMLGKLDHKDMMKQYAISDIFINPSYSEGLPTTVLEAGLMKCAVVATDVGGTSEIIEDGREGLLCKPNIEDIKEKLEEMIQNEELRQKCKENLHRKVIQKFSWEETTKQLQEIIENSERK